MIPALDTGTFLVWGDQNQRVTRWRDGLTLGQSYTIYHPTRQVGVGQLSYAKREEFRKREDTQNGKNR